MQQISFRKIGAALAVALCLLVVVVFLKYAGKPPSTPVLQTPASQPSESPPVKEIPQVSVFAGSLMPGHGDGSLEQAQFVKPYGLCMDGEDILVVDSYNNLIRKISGGQVSTAAGVVTVTDRTGYPLGGYLGGTAEQAMLNRPRFADASSQGVIVFSDSDNNMIRVLDDDAVYLLAGDAQPGYRDGSYQEARFQTPSGVAIDDTGTVFVADTLNHCIRVISGDGEVSTLTGNPTEPGFSDGNLEEARFCEPNDISLGPDGALYVVDKGNQRVRKIYKGVVSTVAGSGTETVQTTGYIEGGYQDGAAAQAQFLYPTGLFVSDSGIIYLADTGNNCIRAISPEGQVATIAGTKSPGNVGGTPEDARFNQPLDVLLSDGMLYVSDSYNHAVRSMPVNENELFR